MTDRTDPRLFIPASVSPEAAAILRMLGTAIASMPRSAPPQTVEEFDAALERSETFAMQMGAAGLAALSPETRWWDVGGVPIVTVRPAHVRDGAAPLVYIHGGGFVQGSARSSLLCAATAAATSGRIVHSIDYALAPRANWRTILDQVTAAWNAIVSLDAGTPGLFGDSAGGCIAAAATLLLRDRGDTLPAALILLSPLVDLAGEGDTNHTLAAVDMLDKQGLAPALRSYAPEEDWAHPLVSPIHGDFARAFPPTLIQVGTRELLLSDAVRFHRALRAAGRRSRLEIYEGMPHVFQRFLADTPEGSAAWREMAEFWADHLA